MDLRKWSALVLNTAPTVEPITRTEAKLQAHITATNEDTDIDTYIVAAREYVEEFLYRRLITSTWDLYLHQFPADDVIEIPYGVLQSVTSITYTDPSGVTKTIDASDYAVDIFSEPGRIVPAFGNVWPSTRTERNAVKIIHKAGYGDASTNVPAAIKTAMRQIVSDIFEHREWQSEIKLEENKLVMRLLTPFRMAAVA